MSNLSKNLATNVSIEIVPENTIISMKKKKGRPRKTPVEIKDTENDVQPEKKKRGRKKKEKVEEEVKQKKKRGRKAALKFFSSTIRKKMPLTTVIYDNDKSILHLDIKDDDDNDIKKNITYNVLKNEYKGLESHKDILGTTLKSLDSNNYSFTSGKFETDSEGSVEDDEESVDLKEDNIIKSKDDEDILCEYIDNNSNDDLDIKELYEKRLESRLVQDSQLVKNLENLHNDDNLLSKLLYNVNKKVKDSSINVVKSNVSENRKKGFFKILLNYIESDNWIDKTNVCCWWCCHHFDSIPIGLPLDYNKNSRKFRVKGVFCSFACMIAYNHNDNNKCDPKTVSMISHLYKSLTGSLASEIKSDYVKLLENDYNLKNLFGNDIELRSEYIESLSRNIDTPLAKAPARCCLKMFGGSLDIEEFRNASKERKVYKMIEYPMYISRDYVEEVDIQNLKKVNKNVFNKVHNVPQTNQLDNTKLEEVKNRVNSSVVVTNNSIDRFIRF